jgi:maltose alpha-D-glucosyltransferase/alpha-amylase
LQARLDKDQSGLTPWFGSQEQSNTILFFGEELTCKLFRQVETVVNPDAEVGRFLTRQGFTHSAPVLGTLEYDGPGLAGTTIGIVHRFVKNQGNACDVTVAALGHSLDEALSLLHSDVGPELPSGGGLRPFDTPPSETAASIVGSYAETARLLGQRCAELHVALASDSQDPDFGPEPFAGHYYRSLFQAATDRLGRARQLLRKSQAGLPERARVIAQEVLARSAELNEKLSALSKFKVEAMRSRCHGDLHLGQILHDGRDFVFIDFEGEPAVSVGVRRLKRSALYDVAGMLRSFHYACVYALQLPSVRPEDRDRQLTLRRPPRCRRRREPSGR